LSSVPYPYIQVTSTTASFVQPASGSNVTVDVADSSLVGPNVFIPIGGYYTLISIPSPTQIEIQNTGFSQNATAGTTIASASGVGNQNTAGLSAQNQTFNSFYTYTDGIYVQVSCISEDGTETWPDNPPLA